jgi:hypothetical protein
MGRAPIVVRRIEEKLGLHASPTCVMGFEGAPAYLLGQAGRGLPQLCDDYQYAFGHRSSWALPWPAAPPKSPITMRQSGGRAAMVRSPSPSMTMPMRAIALALGAG